jgi:predicted Rossmann fold nucleotide-binding protein DprA/Smf involved in DNA uptake
MHRKKRNRRFECAVVFCAPAIFRYDANICMSESAQYIMALLDVPGVGRVAATRMAERFATAEELLACPREQVVLRLKGVAHAAEIAEEIRETLRSRIASAEQRIADLGEHQIDPLTPLDTDWPANLSALDRSDRPVILYTHGPREVLTRKKVALFGRPPLTDEAFERSQTTLRRILRADAVPITGHGNPFDEVVNRVCSSPDHAAPSIVVASGGLDKLPASFRPLAASVVKSGGLLISSFELSHGPFEHDDYERAIVQAGLSDVSVFVEPQDSTPERKALEWVVAARRPAFLIGDVADLPDVHRLADDTDFDWLELAISLPHGEDE